MQGNTIQVTILGSGTSHGVPMIGCGCEVCLSTDPRDKRNRPAIAVGWGDRTLLVDTPPELRLQCIACGVRRVDAVLFTHHHADHVTGLDDLRRFNWLTKKPLPCYGLAETLEVIRRMFAYCFEDDPEYPSHKPELRLTPIEGDKLELFGRRITPIPLLHGKLPVLGYRFGTVAYCTDCSVIPESSFELLRGFRNRLARLLRFCLGQHRIRLPGPEGASKYHRPYDQAIQHRLLI
jgi:phosphoribosyl 1,2-cyclic phosphate phosphodiesterase